MGITNRSGEQISTSEQLAEVATSGSTLVPQEGIDRSPNYTNPTDAHQAFEDLPFVKDSALQRMVTDSTQYPDAVSQIQGFMEGHRLQGVYFKSLNRIRGERSNIVDDPQIRSNIHSAYDRIEQFEITLLKQWDYTHDPESANSKISFVARFYPRFQPFTGDIFLTPIGPGKIGYFRVTTQTADSWRDERCYEANFTMVKHLDQESLDFLTAATARTLIFDKTSYLGGTASLLTSQGYNNLSYLRSQRNIMIRKYYDLFYDDRVSTFIRPDGYYDPYVVRFVNNLASVNVTGQRALQLYYEVDQSYFRTFWSRMEEGLMNDLVDIYPRYICAIRNNRLNDTFLTALTGRGYVSMAYNDEPEHCGGAPENIRYPYVFSEAFYLGTLSKMTPLEKIVYKAIISRSIDDVNTFINDYVKTWGREPRHNRFYITPIYVWLMDVAISTVQSSAS